MSKTYFVSVLGVLLVAGAAVNADAPSQSAPQKEAVAAAEQQPVPDGGMPVYLFPETPERRMARLGTIEDPGIDPSPDRHFYRFGKSFHIEKYERRLAAYDRGPGVVRPLAMVNIAFELYQHNEKWVWVWIPDELTNPRPVETATATAEAQPPRSAWAPEHVAFFKRIQPQFAELTPPDSRKAVQFVEASEGLPTGGSWRNNLAVADMNGDGFADLIAPPERGGRSTGLPTIFLGNGKGQWSVWDVQWPQQLDYGGVAAADFNKDGHQDLVFAVHLQGVYLFLGDGKGRFTPVEEGMLRNYPTRKVSTADVDKDGYQDIVVISEGPTSAGVEKGASHLCVLLNRKKGKTWETSDIAGREVKIGGDWLTVTELNGDTYPDIVAGSRYYNTWDVVHLSEGKNKWRSAASDGDVIPSMSYYFASASGHFTSRKRQDAIVSYVRYWPDVDAGVVPTPPLKQTTNIDRITFTDGGIKREPIMRWGGVEGVWGLGAGDFDGDGNQDVLYTRHNPREAGVLLGDGKGGFTRAAVEGLPMKANTSYDAKVADVNGDGRPDVILMYESAGTTALSDRDGSIHVFLNRGVAAVTRE